MRLSQPHHKSWERFFLVQPVQLNFCRTGICDEAESASSQILGTIFLGSAGSAQLLSDWDL